MDAVSCCKYIRCRYMDGMIFLCPCATTLLQKMLQRVVALAGHANSLAPTNKSIRASTLLKTVQHKSSFITPMSPTQSSVATIRHTHISHTHSSLQQTAHPIILISSRQQLAGSSPMRCYQASATGGGSKTGLGFSTPAHAMFR